MARLKWDGKISPIVFIIAENRLEESYIRTSKKEVSRGVIEGKHAFILSATHPLDHIKLLQDEVVAKSKRASKKLAVKVVTKPKTKVQPKVNLKKKTRVFSKA